jgi:hypothetical protein
MPLGGGGAAASAAKAGDLSNRVGSGQFGSGQFGSGQFGGGQLRSEFGSGQFGSGQLRSEFGSGQLRSEFGSGQFGGGQLRDQFQQNQGQRRDQFQQNQGQRRDQFQQNQQQRQQQRQDRGNQIRQDFDQNHPQWDFWKNHPNYAQYRWNHPYAPATWGAVGAWCGLAAGAAAAGGGGGGDSGDYYDYSDNTAYVNGQQYPIDEQYSQQATNLAEQGAQVQPDSTQWMPLGVFALVADDKGPPVMYLQLAISKQGAISGTYYNSNTKQTLPIAGSLDKSTQRVAFFTSKRTPVVETGLANLTKDQAPCLIHFAGITQNWMLVRLPEPKEGQGNSNTNSSAN